MSFMMSLRASLARPKAKLKKVWPFESKDTDPASQTTRTDPNTKEASESGAWTAVRAMLTAAESGAEWCGPLKTAIGGLIEWVELYERECDIREDKNELRAKLEPLLQDLAKHMECPSGFVSTGSVKQIFEDITNEANKATEKQTLTPGRRLQDILKGADEILDCYRRIDEHLQRLMLNVSLSTLKTVNEQSMESRLAKMSSVKSAFYDSGQVKRGGCAPETRKEQIELLMTWARTPGSGRTCWMNGMAGTGKTTIAYTVCERLGSQLGASFFCSRTIPECRQVNYIIPCIAYQLARFSVPFRHALDSVLEVDPDAHCRTLKQQYERLIVKPMIEVRGSLPSDVIVVIDALDECEDQESVGMILDLLLSPGYDLPVRFLVSSRPESEIYDRMAARTDGSDDTPLVLHDLEAETVRADIKTYMLHELRSISLTDYQWSAILDRCGGLFIYASTVCRFIMQGHRSHTLHEAIQTITDSPSIPVHGANPIDRLYLTILTRAFEMTEQSKENVRRMKAVLETVICAVEPMTLDAIRPLRSVLNVVKDREVVTTLHASFPDFMLSADRSGGFHCDPAMRHAEIASACLRTIDRTMPNFNICCLPSSYLLDSEVDDLSERMRRSISPGLVYASRYWSTHLYLSEHRAELENAVSNLFTQRLLLWLEIINLSGYIRHAVNIVQRAERWCKNITEISHDAEQFVSIYANHPVSLSTPHIYVSMLPFWPRTRPISAAYMARTAGFVEPKGTVMSQRNLALMATWKVSSGPVNSMSLSADGARLAITTSDNINILDASTGEIIDSLANQLTQGVSCAAISPNGTQVAFGGAGSTLQLWDVKGVIPSRHFLQFVIRALAPLPSPPTALTSLPLGPLKGHTEQVTSVTFSLTTRTSHRGHATTRFVSGTYEPAIQLAVLLRVIQVRSTQSRLTILGPLTTHLDWVTSVTFSPNAAFIASGSWDKSIQVYDALTGSTVLGPLQGHIHYVNSVIFSPDSSHLFSCSDDGTVRLWNVQVAVAPAPLSPSWGLSGPFGSVRYSHNGLRIVSGSQDGTIHIWKVQTGELVLGPLSGHDDAISCVGYSLCDKYIASASLDDTLRIWDSETGKDIHGPIQGHNDSVRCIRFSPAETVVASGSDDGSIRLWDFKSAKCVMVLFKADSPVWSVGFSPDGQYVASGLGDGTIRVIDRNTGNTVVGPIHGHRKSVTSIEFSPNGTHIVSSSDERSVRIWDRQTGRQILVCGEGDIPHDSFVSCVGFSPNGRYIASGSPRGAVQVWDAQTGDMIFSPHTRHSKRVRDVQFSPDSSHIVSCSSDGTIRFWNLVGWVINTPQPETIADKEHVVRNSRDGSKAANSWSLDDDGWVFNLHNHRLVWVPSDLRVLLPIPPHNLDIQ
ncbi:peptidase C14 [Rhizoctonia solani]|uniref:Peptidase C14 n=1 Tax=Rhizoctonia solani TaxID=456999 RepID=A0A8H8P164_9AGAM|nr:peptidase C14 [Rhizoctonia solani]QRW22638.1 peptidase C14 [Rhizoctonia solani]